ncbi:MAG: hydrogenase maturation nickel metallochaperone HypA [Anaerolineae bacterium]|nr:hydrogenase maturation nickel metallochaperone HypA [Anaerolineae bacterium]
MHELSITQGILDVALDAAAKAGARRILAIDMVVGELTGFVDDSIRFYFDWFSRNTAAEGAELRIHRRPAQGLCGDCGHVFTVTVPLLPGCPVCGSGLVRVSGGHELHIESIEIDDGNPGSQADPQRQ